LRSDYLLDSGRRIKDNDDVNVDISAFASRQRQGRNGRREVPIVERKVRNPYFRYIFSIARQRTFQQKYVCIGLAKMRTMNS
jgi:hypothetical protein